MRPFRIRTDAFRCVIAFALVAVFGGAANASIQYTGGGSDPNDLFEAGNYDFSASPLSEILYTNWTSDYAVNDDLAFTGATLVSEGPSFEIFWQLRIGTGHTMTFNNTALDTRRVSDPIGNGGLGGVGRDARIEILNGSDIRVRFLAGGTYRLDASSRLELRGQTRPLNDIHSATGDVAVDLDPGATMYLTHVDTDRFVSEFLRLIYVEGEPADGVGGGGPGGGIGAGELSVELNQQAPLVLIEPYNNGLGTKVTAIPEPGSLVLLGVGGIMLARRRRV